MTALAFGGHPRCFEPDPDVRQATYERIDAAERQLTRDNLAERERRIDVATAALPADVPEQYRRRVATRVVDALTTYSQTYADPWQTEVQP